MKTTIDLPDETLKRAKIFAAERETTLKDVMTHALEQFMSTPPESEEKARQKKLKRLLKGMQAANEVPMQPLTREEIYDR